MSFLPGGFPAAAAAAGAPVQNFPVVAATNTGGTTTGGATSFNVPLPASIAAGDLLLITIALKSNGATTLTTPTDWTELYNTVAGGDLRRMASYWKVASGSEGATQNVVSNSASSTWATTSYRITGYQGSPESGVTATGSSAAPNPPSLSPSWGSAKTLWIAVMGDASESAGVPTPPTSYLSQIVGNATVAGVQFGRNASARRELEAASDDPSAFAIAASTPWAAQTIAIRPA